MSKLSYIEQERPVLSAKLNGTEGNEKIRGEVNVYKLENGLFLCADFSNLPPSQSLPFHIHEGKTCDDAGGHFLEFPDIMSDRYGEASARYYFDRKTLDEISGKPIMLHIKSGNDEPKIACGILERVL